MLGEARQQLGLLVREQLLSAFAGVDASQEGTELSGLPGEALVDVNEAMHRANNGIIELKQS
jgi:hypothetical protein